MGRYIAALTFLNALTGVDISKVTWGPKGVDEKLRESIIFCALRAVEYPWQMADKIRMESIYENR